MYLSSQFATQDAAHASALIRAYPFASLISVDDQGLPFVTPLPLHLIEEAGRWLLLGHCAKANPHWRYLTVHCTVQARLIEDFDDKDRLIKHLIHDHDPVYEQQWRALGDDYQHKMMAGMVAFELEVTDLQCKLKLNQHRPESHQAMHAVYAAGNDDQRALAQWMVRLGLVERLQGEH